MPFEIVEKQADAHHPRSLAVSVHMVVCTCPSCEGTWYQHLATITADACQCPHCEEWVIPDEDVLAVLDDPARYAKGK